MATKKLHFETLQVHVGQNRPIPQQMHAPSLFIRQHLMYFIIHNMRQTVLAFVMQGIFMAVLPIRHRVFSKRVSPLSKGE